jgi:hypothetical protein
MQKGGLGCKELSRIGFFERSIIAWTQTWTLFQRVIGIGAVTSAQ